MLLTIKDVSQHTSECLGLFNLLNCPSKEKDNKIHIFLSFFFLLLNKNPISVSFRGHNQSFSLIITQVAPSANCTVNQVSGASANSSVNAAVVLPVLQFLLQQNTMQKVRSNHLNHSSTNIYCCLQHLIYLVITGSTC